VCMASRFSRLLLVLICCSTPENCTSWLVNSLVSMGDNGSWFCSCVVSNNRKSSKSWFSCVADCVEALAVVLVELETSMSVTPCSLNHDVHALQSDIAGQACLFGGIVCRFDVIVCHVAANAAGTCAFVTRAAGVVA